MWEVKEQGQTKGHICFNTSSFTWTWQMFVAGLSVGSAPVLFLGRGGHGRIRRQSGLTWVCWWRQVTEEEVHLCRAAAAGHHLLSLFIFLLHRRCGGRWHGGRGFSATDTALLMAGVMLSGGMCLLGYAPHALPITCGRRAAVEGKDRVRLTDPACDGVILGLFCRARTD